MKKLDGYLFLFADWLLAKTEEKGVIGVNYDGFFCEELKELIETGEFFPKLGKSALICSLDDIVQIIANKTNEQWTLDTSREHRTYKKLLGEIASRLKDKPVKEKGEWVHV